MVVELWGIGLDVWMVSVVSLIGLSLSIHNFRRNKPIIVVEKDSAEKHSDTIMFFRFYLSNLGEKPTTIKNIEFYTKNNKFMPKVTLIESLKESIPTGNIAIINNSVKGIKLPFNLAPNSSKRIKAILDFSTEDNFKQEHTEDEIHYFIRVICSKEIIEKWV